MADRYGVAVDFSIHSPDSKTDARNHHTHIMMTTRKLEASGLGEKSTLELENKKLIALGLPTSHDQLRDIRNDWEERANHHLARAGHERSGVDVDREAPLQEGRRQGTQKAAQSPPASLERAAHVRARGKGGEGGPLLSL